MLLFYGIIEENLNCLILDILPCAERFFCPDFLCLHCKANRICMFLSEYFLHAGREQQKYGITKQEKGGAINVE